MTGQEIILFLALAVFVIAAAKTLNHLDEKEKKKKEKRGG